MEPSPDVRAFFDRYTAALLARDSDAVASLYAVPALILFPEQAVAVSDREQTRSFFDAAWQQYVDVEGVATHVDVIAATAHSRWVDVTWLHDGEASERFVYQLVRSDDRWQIAVLTPVGLTD